MESWLPADTIRRAGFGQVVANRRHQARWYTTKTHPSYHDMLVKLRRTLIAAQYCADPTDTPTPEQIHTIRLAWANATA